MRVFWRIRAGFHRLWAGHKPDYYVFGGMLSNRLYVACRTCDDGPSYEARKKLEDRLKRVSVSSDA
jgi:hypothetical protein